MTRDEEILKAALEDAIDGMEEMLPYIDSYFRRKWQLEAYLARAQIALAKVEEPFTADRS